MQQQDWMAALAEHDARVRAAHPDDQLVVVFDIDGTILDTRHMIRHVLQAYDRAHRTKAFARLELEDVDVPESHLGELLGRLGLPEVAREHVLGWFADHSRSSEALRAAHRPFHGVLDVIRWLQMQPRTEVALNSGRPERERADTLACLNDLGAASRVRFDDALLLLDAEPHRKDVAAAKVAGLRRLVAGGYRVVAVIDDEAENLRVMESTGVQEDILFLHARHLFAPRDLSSARSVGGDAYELLPLAHSRPLPGHLSLVWSGLDERESFEAFLQAPVTWGAVTVAPGPSGRVQVGASTRPRGLREGPTGDLAELLRTSLAAGKNLRFDLTEGGELVDALLELLEREGATSERVAFGARTEDLGPSGFRHLKWAFPESPLQAPVSHLGPLSLTVAERTRELLDTYASWGITRFGLSWSDEHLRHLLGFLEADGREVDVSGVPDLKSFFQAALLAPDALTADFRFPQWLEGRAMQESARLDDLRRLVPVPA